MIKVYKSFIAGLRRFPPQNCQKGSSLGPTALRGIPRCGLLCLFLSFRSLASVWGCCWSLDHARGVKCCRGSLKILMGRFSPKFWAWWRSSRGNLRRFSLGTPRALKKEPCRTLGSLLQCFGRWAKRPPLGVFRGRRLILCREEWEGSTPSQIWCNRSTCQIFRSNDRSTQQLRDIAANS